MNDTDIQNLINRYNELLSNINEVNIKSLELGFTINSCNAEIFTILIHCIENIEIFNESQFNSIYNYINKINYGI